MAYKRIVTFLNSAGEEIVRVEKTIAGVNDERKAVVEIPADSSSAVIYVGAQASQIKAAFIQVTGGSLTLQTIDSAGDDVDTFVLADGETIEYDADANMTNPFSGNWTTMQADTVGGSTRTLTIVLWLDATA